LLRPSRLVRSLRSLCLCLALVLGGPGLTFGAAREQVTLYFFWAKGCPHCVEQKRFLDRLSRELPFLRIRELELTSSPENREILRQVSRVLKVELAAVPFTVVGDRWFVGWQGEAVTGAGLRQAVLEAAREGWPDMVAPFLSQGAQAPARETVSHRLVLPWVGEIDLGKLPLLTLTLLLGALDGFNPCAMWALVFLIGLLLGLENRWRRWVLGSVFILGSGVVYFAFMAAWLNIFLFLGLIVWIRLGIGLVAVAAGAAHLRAYVWDRGEACPMLGSERRRTFLERIRQAVAHRSFGLAVAGVFLLGLAVNLVELICSVGLPVVYTQILALTPLSPWAYYAFLALYIFVFMLDDLVVFVISMLTLEHLGLTGRYQRFSRLLGGVVLTGVGFLLIFKPEWLMFG